MRLITINGPLGVGKTWVFERLNEHYRSQGLFFQGVHFQDSLKKICYSMLDVESSVPYDVFKAKEYYGHTGRQWMIHLSENMGELYPPLWVQKSFNQMLRLEEMPLDPATNRIYLADSQGFALELEFLKEKRRLSQLELLTISIEPPEKRHLRGTRWQSDDSRYNLAHMCDIVVETSSDAYLALRAEIYKRGWA